VFQSYALYPHMSVRKNIESPLIARRAQRPSSTERNERVLEAASALGLEGITEGTVRIGERVVNDVAPKDRDIAMVFQNYALYPHMTVFDNIAFALKLAKVPKSEIEERVHKAAEILELTENLERKPGQLSGGQRQRVAMGRAIVRQPAAFLMDEPLSNLDAKLRAQTRVELVELHRQLATTIVYVTHDQVEAMTMADRVAVLDQGRLQQVGAPREVYDRPANLFVARFIGSPPMNTLPGRVQVDAGRTWVAVGTGRLAAVIEGVPEGAEVVVGVRPEHLDVGESGIPATVRAVEWLGYERHLYCDVGGSPVIVRDSEEGENGIRPGDDVVLTASAHHVHLFDPTSTERLG